MNFFGFDRMGGLMFAIIPILVSFGFIFVFGTIIFRMITGMKQWKENNESPILEVEAVVVTKRSDVHRHNNNTGVDNMTTSSYSTNYYVTFEVMSGDRMELEVPAKEYGMLVENDAGILKFQGTRYLGFERMMNKKDQ